MSDKRIPPTIGRKILLRLNGCEHDVTGRAPVVNDPAQPLDADIVFVHDSEAVNLSARDHAGYACVFHSVPIVYEGDAYPSEGGPYAEWMPYQLGQAAKTEAAETAAAAGAASKKGGK